MDNNLGAKDICGILKACHSARVLRLSFEGLVVEFEASSPVENSATFTGRSQDSQPLKTMHDAGMTDATEFLLTPDQQENLAEIDETNLLMTDPVQFEKNIIDNLMSNQGIQ